MILPYGSNFRRIWQRWLGVGIGDWDWDLGYSNILKFNRRIFDPMGKRLSKILLNIFDPTGKDNIFLPSSNIIKNQKVQTLVIILLYTILYSTISHSFELVLNLVEIIFFLIGWIFDPTGKLFDPWRPILIPTC